jgi:hypothetical protein
VQATPLHEASHQDEEDRACAAHERPS